MAGADNRPRGTEPGGAAAALEPRGDPLLLGGPGMPSMEPLGSLGSLNMSSILRHYIHAPLPSASAPVRAQACLACVLPFLIFPES